MERAGESNGRERGRGKPAEAGGDRPRGGRVRRDGLQGAQRQARRLVPHAPGRRRRAGIVFHGCDIHEKRSSGGPITAASTPAGKTYGYLFYRSRITGAANGKTSLGRPWRPDAQVLYRESTLSATIANAQPWTNMSDNTWQKARFKEYRNTGAGATVNSNRPQLSDSQAANHTPQKYLAGSDGWNPVG